LRRRRRVLNAVEKATTTSPGTAPRDLNDMFLGSAYGRAYRCICSIRELALPGRSGRRAHTDAFASHGRRSGLYIVEPDDPAKRERRLASWRLSWAREALRTSTI
jgi:hypothetical protein